MAGPAWWVSTGEISEGREGTPFNADGNREYTRSFQVLVNTKAVDPVTVGLTAPEIPRPFQAYTDPLLTVVDNLSVVTKIRARNSEDDWTKWIVTVNYGTREVRKGAGTSGHPEKDKPEDEEPEVDWDSEVEAIALSEDLDGKLVVNSAGDPFNPAPTHKVACPVLTITRNEPTWSRANQQSRSFVLNSDKFLDALARQVLMYPPKARKVYKGNLKHWKVTYRLVFLNTLEKGKTGWQLRLLDTGMRQLAMVQTSPLVFATIPIPVIQNGHPVAHPVLLDGNGKVIRRDAQGKPLNPVWLDFRTLRELAFAPLKLDQYVD